MHNFRPRYIESDGIVEISRLHTQQDLEKYIGWQNKGKIGTIGIRDVSKEGLRVHLRT